MWCSSSAMMLGLIVQVQQIHHRCRVLPVLVLLHLVEAAMLVFQGMPSSLPPSLRGRPPSMKIRRILQLRPKTSVRIPYKFLTTFSTPRYNPRILLPCPWQPRKEPRLHDHMDKCAQPSNIVLEHAVTVVFTGSSNQVLGANMIPCPVCHDRPPYSW